MSYVKPDAVLDLMVQAGVGKAPPCPEGPDRARIPLGGPAWLRHHAGLHGHAPDAGGAGGCARLPGRIRHDRAAGARAGHRQLRPAAPGTAGAAHRPGRASGQLGARVRRQPCRQRVLRLAVHPHGDAGLRDGAAARGRGRGEDPRLREGGHARRRGRGSQGHSLQLDDHPWCGDGAHFTVYGGQDCGHVATHSHLLRPGLRALRGQHVRYPRRDAHGRGGERARLVAVEPDPGHARKHRRRHGVHRHGAAGDLSPAHPICRPRRGDTRGDGPGPLMGYYPVSLDLTGRLCLVVGGGATALRKVAGLLGADARVTVVSPWLTLSLLHLATEAQFRWRPREYVAGDAVGFALVMAATDDVAVNAAVAAECRERGIWINCADDPDRCDFILPSVLKRGALTVSVSTGGASPTMARLVREELETLLPRDVAVLTDVMAEVRRTLRDGGISLDAERWREALDDELRRLAAAGRTAEARSRLLERLGV